jgi:hypothetical protein
MVLTLNENVAAEEKSDINDDSSRSVQKLTQKQNMAAELSSFPTARKIHKRRNTG